MSSVAAAPARDAALFPPALAANFAGAIAGSCMPVTIGALIARGLSESQAGLLGTLELLTAAAVALGLGALVHRLPLRRLALFGACLGIAANLVAAFASGVALLTLARIAAGAGAGVCLMVGYSVIALAVDSVRFSAWLTVVDGLLIAGLLAVLPAIAARHGLAGIFSAYAVLLSLCLMPMPLLPRRSGAAQKSAPAPALDWPPVARLLGGAFVIYVAMMALWAFTEQIGTVAVKLDARTLGQIFAASTLLGLLGAVLPSVLGERLGYSLPVAGGLLAFAACAWLLGAATTAGVFTITQIVWGFAYSLAVPVLLGLAARLDVHGRVSAMFSGACLLGAALGPAAGGWTVNATSLAGLGMTTAALALSALALVWPLTKR